MSEPTSGRPVLASSLREAAREEAERTMDTVSEPTSGRPVLASSLREAAREEAERTTGAVSVQQPVPARPVAATRAPATGGPP